MTDNVNHPSHYEKECSIECIEAMELVLGVEGLIKFCMGNAFKYLWRYKHKNGSEDLEKAAWYIEKAQNLNEDYDSVVIQEKLESLEKTLMHHANEMGANIL